MGEKSFWQKNKKLILTIFIIWAVIYIIFAVMTFAKDTPVLCTDGFTIDPVTGEQVPTGGCSPQPHMVIPSLIIALIIWLCLLLLGLWALYGLTKKK